MGLQSRSPCTEVDTKLEAKVEQTFSNTQSQDAAWWSATQLRSYMSKILGGYSNRDPRRTFVRRLLLAGADAIPTQRYVLEVMVRCGVVCKSDKVQHEITIKRRNKQT
ncbi:hypothetical protein TanjilG_32472 [Lupinus angustifolius]|uniref:Uncharacterized protein n=1 Tax=Lupinus angustifolius TaxID=3871 RepID=A0A1J7HI93_LUPAN|nr:hypothetical protein TanjilG_32472 [Lupinus angustifolius]